jgi:hypothetical protein
MSVEYELISLNIFYNQSMLITTFPKCFCAHMYSYALFLVSYSLKPSRKGEKIKKRDLLLRSVNREGLLINNWLDIRALDRAVHVLE